MLPAMPCLLQLGHRCQPAGVPAREALAPPPPRWQCPAVVAAVQARRHCQQTGWPAREALARPPPRTLLLLLLLLLEEVVPLCSGCAAAPS